MKWGTTLNRSKKSALTSDRTLSFVVLTLLFTVLLLALTDGYYAVWSPMLGQLTLPTFPVRTALGILFFWDVFVFAALISLSGGAAASPFTSALFLVPALAIFLRVPVWLFLTYSSLCGILYLLLSAEKFELPSVYEEQSTNMAAHRFVNLMCLSLATLIGLITAPSPI